MYWKNETVRKKTSKRNTQGNVVTSKNLDGNPKLIMTDDTQADNVQSVNGSTDVIGHIGQIEGLDTNNVTQQLQLTFDTGMMDNVNSINCQ